MLFNTEKKTATDLDKKDPLAKYRAEFHFPKTESGDDYVYLCGHSLGLQPKKTKEKVDLELTHWAEKGVEGHFTGDNPWVSYHRPVSDLSAELIGAKKEETIVMNSLSVNLNLLMVSFYNPEQTGKTDILIEKTTFPSDVYALKSHLHYHNLTDHHLRTLPALHLCTDTATIIDFIEDNEDRLALVFLGAVNYLSGQLFDIKAIADTCKKHEITFGLDLAHAIGNVPLQLHEWGVDFAVWCTYKYLNSGPGAVGGAFIHEKHLNKVGLHKFHGWWSNDEANRFEMLDDLTPYKTAEEWQMSNAPILSMAAHSASLELFQQVGISALREKSLQLTAYLEFLISALEKEGKPVSIVTPNKANERGAMLTIKIKNSNKSLIEELKNKGVLADWRRVSEKEGLLRVAPVPFYNSYQDVYTFYEILSELI